MIAATSLAPSPLPPSLSPALVPVSDDPSTPLLGSELPPTIDPTAIFDLPRTAEQLSTLFELDSTPSRPRPRAQTLSHSAFGSFGTFPSTARAGPLPAPTLISSFKLFWLQLFANTASALFLALIVVWALSSRGLAVVRDRLLGRARVERRRREWDDQKTYENEKTVKSIQYYARSCGFDVQEQTVTTKDGYLLKVFKVEVLGGKSQMKSDGRQGYPVLIMHGLFQSCGSFITSEERSLAFWLAKHGSVLTSSPSTMADAL